MSSVEANTEPNPEPGGVRLREYEARDFARICELDQMCFPPLIAYEPEEIWAALAQPHAFCVVAEHQAQVIGFILAYYRRGVGHIITIDIQGEFRSRSVGSRLMEEAERRMSGHGVRRVVLEVGVDNEPAIRFYKGRGYGTERRLDRYYRDGSDGWRMEKAL